MNRLFLGLFCLCLALFSCKQNQGNGDGSSVEKQEQEITETDISKMDYIEFLLDEKTEGHVQGWVEYDQIFGVLNSLKAGDLSFFNDNKEGVYATLEEFKVNIPEPLHSPSIVARITAFETKFLKLESLYNLSSTNKEELLITIKGVLVAFSNLNLQMNKKVEIDGQNIQKP